MRKYSRTRRKGGLKIADVKKLASDALALARKIRPLQRASQVAGFSKQYVPEKYKSLVGGVENVLSEGSRVTGLGRRRYRRRRSGGMMVSTGTRGMMGGKKRRGRKMKRRGGLDIGKILKSIPQTIGNVAKGYRDFLLKYKPVTRTAALAGDIGRFAQNIPVYGAPIGQAFGIASNAGRLVGDVTGTGKMVRVRRKKGGAKKTRTARKKPRTVGRSTRRGGQAQYVPVMRAIRL